MTNPKDTLAPVTEALKPCPFCGASLRISRGAVNKVAMCDTDDCWMHERKNTVPLDDLRQVDQWNTRANPIIGESGALREALTIALAALKRIKQPMPEIAAWAATERQEIAREALAQIAALPADGVGVDETGWLIEHENEPVWLTLRPGEAVCEVCWTKDSLEALRFCRRADAEDYVSAHFGGDGPLCITEHQWPAHPPKPAPAASSPEPTLGEGREVDDKTFEKMTDLVLRAARFINDPDDDDDETIIAENAVARILTLIPSDPEPAASAQPVGMVGVTEADRERSLPIMRWLSMQDQPKGGIFDQQHMEGDNDGHFIVQAIAAHRQASAAMLVEAIERALECTPHIRNMNSLYHLDIPHIVYDCGDPWEILRDALSPDAVGKGE